MIVEPRSTNHGGRLRRAVGTAGLVVPVLLLAGVVAAGLAGPKVEAPPGDRSPMPPASSPTSDEAAVRTPRPAPSGIPVGPLPPLPAAAADLAVRSVADVQPELAAATGRPLAVVGWLMQVRTHAGCETAEGDTRGLLSPLCERTARLLIADPGSASPSTHLHVRVPPGVRLPPPFEWPGAADADPVLVILIGRARGHRDPCLEQARGCRQQFTADRVAWAAGEPFEPGIIFDAGLDVPLAKVAYRRRAVAESLAAGTSGTVLVSAAVRPRTIAAIDPEAAAALAQAPEPAGLVWYVRALQTVYESTRFPPGDYPARLTWVLVDETTGATLAAGVSGRPVVTTAAPRPPGEIADQPVDQATGTVFARSVAEGGTPQLVSRSGRRWRLPAHGTRTAAVPDGGSAG